MLDGHPTSSRPASSSSTATAGSSCSPSSRSGPAARRTTTWSATGSCAPAGMTRTDFLRSDDLPGDAAIGYVEVDGVERSNVLHLPVHGDRRRRGPHHRRGRAPVLDRAGRRARRVGRRPSRRWSLPRDTLRGESRYGLGFWVDPVDDERGGPARGCRRRGCRSCSQHDPAERAHGDRRRHDRRGRVAAGEGCSRRGWSTEPPQTTSVPARGVRRARREQRPDRDADEQVHEPGGERRLDVGPCERQECRDEDAQGHDPAEERRGLGVRGRAAAAARRP